MKEKEYFIKREQDDAKGSIKVIKRDFYDDLPRAVCEVLDNISWRWRNYEWFDEAWNKYRDHVINSSAGGLGIKAPGFIFNDYIDEQVKQDFLNREQMEVLHSELGIDELMHYNEKHVPAGQPGAGQFAKKTDAEKASNNKEDKSEKMKKEDEEFRTKLNRLKAQNEMRKAIEEYNNNLPEEVAKRKKEKATEEDYNRSISMLKSGRDITNDLITITREVPGTVRTNPKETKINDDRPYKEISDEELNKRVRRMQLERQYGDLTGDTKYVQTGKEQTRERLQTIGALLGIGVSVLTIYKSLKNKGS